MAVLLEYKGCKREINIANVPSACEAVARELKKLGKDALVAISRGECSSSTSTAREDGRPVYVLQKWSSKWDTYVDVADVGEINAGDRLTVVAKPTGSPQDSVSQKTCSVACCPVCGVGREMCMVTIAVVEYT